MRITRNDLYFVGFQVFRWGGGLTGFSVEIQRRMCRAFSPRNPVPAAYLGLRPRLNSWRAYGPLQSCVGKRAAFAKIDNHLRGFCASRHGGRRGCGGCRVCSRDSRRSLPKKGGYKNRRLASPDLKPLSQVCVAIFIIGWPEGLHKST